MDSLSIDGGGGGGGGRWLSGGMLWGVKRGLVAHWVPMGEARPCGFAD